MFELFTEQCNPLDGFMCTKDLIYLLTVVFISLHADTPAFRCGVQSGDQLTKVNDVSLLALSTEESTSLLNKV